MSLCCWEQCWNVVLYLEELYNMSCGWCGEASEVDLDQT
eukprot:COSAG06_NODE_7350_length_2534_cov_19.102669_5_plen_39_part_00